MKLSLAGCFRKYTVPKAEQRIMGEKLVMRDVYRLKTFIILTLDSAGKAKSIILEEVMPLSVAAQTRS